MRLRIIAEGSTKWQRMVKHWGLSILIDDDILFDTFGKPDYVLKQLKRLNEHIDKIKYIVISHDDWDHVTGLGKILEQNRLAKVYVCPNFKPEIKKDIKRYGVIPVEIKGLTNIRMDVFSSGELAGSRNSCHIPEQYLAIKTLKGLVVLTGCAHPGIVEIAQHAKAAFGSDISLLVGGFHLKDHTAEEIGDIVLKLRSLKVGRVVPFHCTGLVAQNIFIEQYGRDCIVPKEGQIIEI